MINHARFTLASFTVLVIFIPAMNANGETITDSIFGFHFTTPDGFVSQPTQVHDDVIYAFWRRSGQDQGDTLIRIKHLGGRIPQEKLDLSQVTENGQNFTLTTEKWKGFNINVFRLTGLQGKIPYVQFNAQVPLVPMAMQVSVAGPSSSENETRAVLRKLLDTIDGETNWLTSEQTANNSTSRMQNFMAGFVVVFILYVLLLRRSDRKKSDLMQR
jgi:hypothetical protein